MSSPLVHKKCETRTVGLICLGLALLTALAYVRVLSADFINLDDPFYVTWNRVVASGLNENSVKWAFTNRDAYNWHPLTWISHELDVELFGMTPAGPHAVNVLIHIANSILIFLLLRRMTGALWRSAFVAGLFALHPIH